MAVLALRALRRAAIIGAVMASTDQHSIHEHGALDAPARKAAAPRLARVQGGSVVDAAILAVLVCAFYSVFLTGRRVSPGADLANLFLPMKAFTRAAFAQGVVPLWNPYAFCGAPFLATMQAAALYPLNLPAIAFDNLVFGVNMYRLLHLWWMALGVCVFLRVCQRAPRLVAIGCALALPCGTFMHGHLEHLNQLAAIAWFPWWMAALWFCLRAPSARVALALGVCGGMQWLAGHPQQVVFTLLLSFFYLLAGTLFGRARRRARVWVCAACGVALAAGLGFAQILPAVELSGRSLRVFDDLGVANVWPPKADEPERYAAQYAFRPEFLILAVRPHAFGSHRDGFTSPDNFFESGCYVGLLVLAGAVLGAALAVWRRRREQLFWTGAIVAALVFALGDATPAHWLASVLLPALRHFRAPPRILFIAMFGLSVLGAAGWRAIGEWLQARTLRQAQGGLRWLAAGLLWVFAACVWLDLRLVFAKDFSAAPVDARALESPTYWPRLAEKTEGYRVFRLMPDDGDVYQDTRGEAVAERLKRLQPNSNLVAGVAAVDGYEEGLLPLARTLDFQLRFHRNLFSPTPDAALLALLNARYVMSALPVESPALSEEAELMVRGAQRDYLFHRNEIALPRIAHASPLRAAMRLDRLEGEWRLSGGARRRPADRDRPTLDYWRPGFGAGLEVEGLKDFFQSVGQGIVAQTPDCNRVALRLAAGAPSDGEFLMLQAPYPRWFVRADGATGLRPLKPVCAIASAFEIAPDATGATLVYRPWSFQLGLFVSLGAWLAVVAAWIGLVRKPTNEEVNG